MDSLFPICRYTAEIMQSTIELANSVNLRNMLEMRQNSVYFEAAEEIARRAVSKKSIPEEFYLIG